jgi:hypothetical protein
VLVRWLVGRRGDVHDRDVPELRARPRLQVGQPGFLGALAQRDLERVALTRIAVPADLQPSLLALVPAQQHPPGGRVHDHRGPGDVQRLRAQPRVRDGRGERADPFHVGGLGLALRAVPAEQVEQGGVGCGHG